MHSVTSNFYSGTSNHHVNYIDSFFLSSLRLIIICSSFDSVLVPRRFRELLSAERVDGATGPPHAVPAEASQ